jgi:hypothetical protein
MPFFHRTNYERFEPLNSTLMSFNKYCDLFGSRNDESRNVFRERLRSALLEERLGWHRLKYAQYIKRNESGFKNNPRGFFKYVNM